MDDTESLCTFHVDRLHFGLPVSAVQEVLRMQEMTRVPLASNVVRGLINLRGQIVTAVDLRRRLGFTDAPAELEPTNVVVRSDDGPVSLLVDNIGDVLDVERSRWDEVPATIPPRVRSLVSGVFKLDDGLLFVLDKQRALSLADEPS